MRVKVLTVCALFLLVAAPVFAQQVSVNYDHGVSFAQYHTYAWGGNNTNADPELDPGTSGAAGHQLRHAG